MFQHILLSGERDTSLEFASLSVGVMHKLKQLMQIISQISPFKPNYSDLARDISVARNDLKDYLFYRASLKIHKILYIKQ